MTQSRLPSSTSAKSLLAPTCTHEQNVWRRHIKNISIPGSIMALLEYVYTSSCSHTCIQSTLQRTQYDQAETCCLPTSCPLRRPWICCKACLICSVSLAVAHDTLQTIYSASIHACAAVYSVQGTAWRGGCMKHARGSSWVSTQGELSCHVDACEFGLHHTWDFSHCTIETTPARPVEGETSRMSG